ncbi:unnamed protein product [Gordionus sp. m RMFG-2023]|uniref:uncharacterized protein LOC135929189 isoform X2 n=1 Tax=Gordionus sp. m RMFG-2023 TaxID=3053472 RepID=UPI0030E0B784
MIKEENRKISKFRNLFGKGAVRKSETYEGLRISRHQSESCPLAVNPKWMAVSIQSEGGGSFVVLPLWQKGRIDDSRLPHFSGHSRPAIELAWNPFDDDVLATGSEDATVKIWQVASPQCDAHHNSSIDSTLLLNLQRHDKRINCLSWHPSASNILATTSCDARAIIWNTETGQAFRTIVDHEDSVWDLAWNYDGSLLATTCKDRMLRIIDPRKGSTVVEARSHQGVKSSRVFFVDRDPYGGAQHYMITTGFSRMSERQIAVWDQRDMKEPLSLEIVDSSPGALFPFFDQETGILYIGGKGDGNIRFYEFRASSLPPSYSTHFTIHNPSSDTMSDNEDAVEQPKIDEAHLLSHLGVFQTSVPQTGLCAMPKRGLDTSICEIFRFYKLRAGSTSANNISVVEPISMIVPRKSSVYQEDLYPPTASPRPALQASEWISGKNSNPLLVSLKNFAGSYTEEPPPKPGQKPLSQLGVLKSKFILRGNERTENGSPSILNDLPPLPATLLSVKPIAQPVKVTKTAALLNRASPIFEEPSKYELHEKSKKKDEITPKKLHLPTIPLSRLCSSSASDLNTSVREDGHKNEKKMLYESDEIAKLQQDIQRLRQIKLVALKKAELDKKNEESMDTEGHVYKGILSHGDGKRDSKENVKNYNTLPKNLPAKQRDIEFRENTKPFFISTTVKDKAKSFVNESLGKKLTNGNVFNTKERNKSSPGMPFFLSQINREGLSTTNKRCSFPPSISSSKSSLNTNKDHFKDRPFPTILEDNKKALKPIDHPRGTHATLAKEESSTVSPPLTSESPTSSSNRSNRSSSPHIKYSKELPKTAHSTEHKILHKPTDVISNHTISTIATAPSSILLSPGTSSLSTTGSMSPVFSDFERSTSPRNTLAQNSNYRAFFEPSSGGLPDRRSDPRNRDKGDNNMDRGERRRKSESMRVTTHTPRTIRTRAAGDGRAEDPSPNRNLTTTLLSGNERHKIVEHRALTTPAPYVEEATALCNELREENRGYRMEISLKNRRIIELENEVAQKNRKIKELEVECGLDKLYATLRSPKVKDNSTYISYNSNPYSLKDHNQYVDRPQAFNGHHFTDNYSMNKDANYQHYLTAKKPPPSVPAKFKWRTESSKPSS